MIYKICLECGRKYTKADLHKIWVMQGYNNTCLQSWASFRKYCGPWCREFRNPRIKRIIMGDGIIFTRKDFLNYKKQYGEKFIRLRDFSMIEGR